MIVIPRAEGPKQSHEGIKGDCVAEFILSAADGLVKTLGKPEDLGGASEGSMTSNGRASWILAIVAHVLAWVAYLPLAVGLVILSYLRGGSGEGPGVLIAVFVPVALTGLALLTVLAARRNRDISLLAARVRVVPILLALMAGLAIYTVSQVHLPWGPRWSLASPSGG